MSTLSGDARRTLRRSSMYKPQKTGGWFAAVTSALLTLAVLGGCADDSGQRQFANDPRTPGTTPTQAVTPEQVASPVPRLPQASPETLVDRRGAPAVVYAYVDGALRSFDGSDQHIVADGPVAAFDASPSGNRVAVVTSSSPDTREQSFTVTVHDQRGEVAQSFDGVLTAPSPSATPEGDSLAPPSVYVSWAPQGGRLLLSHPSGQLVDIPLEGEPASIETRSSLEGVFQAEWSPRGDAIGVLLRDGDGRGELAIVSPSDTPATVTVIAPAGDGSGGVKSVEQFGWQPNSSGVLFLEMQRSDAGLADGKIIGWEQETNSSTIIATGGQGGPSGSVTSFSVSPDGEAVLYRIAIMSDDGWSFNGLYVRSLVSGQTHRLPVDGDAAVSGAWWIKNGVLWSQVVRADAAGAATEILLATEDAATRQLASFANGQSGTPIASPAPRNGHQDASPVAGNATPIAATPAS